jgi:hypothetical protein
MSGVIVEASLYFVTYLAMGGHPSLSFIGDFLLSDAEKSFGSAVEKIDFYLHVDRRDRPLAAGDSLSERFEAHIRSLPNAWFKRRKRRIELSYASQLGFAEELLFQKNRHITVEQFDAGCREVVGNIPIIRTKLGVIDDFDFDALHAHVKRRVEQVPATDADLTAVLQQLKAAQKLLP